MRDRSMSKTVPCSYEGQASSLAGATRNRERGPIPAYGARPA